MHESNNKQGWSLLPALPAALVMKELTKNTTRVVETAVRGEVQNSVLPSLENITKTEVKSAMSSQIARGFGDSMKLVSVMQFVVD